MAKFKLTVAAGVAAIYPVGQEGQGKTMKQGESVELDVPVGPHAEHKGGKPFDVLSMAKEDLGAPAAGVATSEPIDDREGTVEVAVLSGRIVLRKYEGAEFVEQELNQGSTVSVPITESNRITLAVYDAAAAPK
jgi:hypothetical protein